MAILTVVTSGPTSTITFEESTPDCRAAWMARRRPTTTFTVWDTTGLDPIEIQALRKEATEWLEGLKSARVSIPDSEFQGLADWPQ